MHELISIVIPVYNVEKYLKQCLDSIINQTYTNLEIILVDDGNTDNSGTICDYYSKIDKRIRVIHKKNEGQSIARNIGIKVSNGKYIGFLDSDDWVEQDMYRFLIENIEKYNADIISCNLVFEYKDRTIVPRKENNTIIFFDENNKKDLIKNFLLHKIYDGAVWNKLYKKELFDNIIFPINQYYEDNFIVFDLLNAANKIIITNKLFYHYRQNDNSTTKRFSPKKYIDEMKAIKHNIEIIQKNYLNFVKLAKQEKILCYFKWMDIIIFSNDSNIKYKSFFQKQIKKHFMCMLFANNINIKIKIALILMILNVNIYKKLRKTQKNISKSILQ